MNVIVMPINLAACSNTYTCMHSMYLYLHYLCTLDVCTHELLFHVENFLSRISIGNIIIPAMPGYGSMEMMIRMSAYVSWVVCHFCSVELLVVTCMLTCGGFTFIFYMILSLDPLQFQELAVHFRIGHVAQFMGPIFPTIYMRALRIIHLQKFRYIECFQLFDLWPWNPLSVNFEDFVSRDPLSVNLPYITS